MSISHSFSIIVLSISLSSGSLLGESGCSNTSFSSTFCVSSPVLSSKFLSSFSTISNTCSSKSSLFLGRSSSSFTFGKSSTFSVSGKSSLFLLARFSASIFNLCSFLALRINFFKSDSLLTGTSQPGPPFILEFHLPPILLISE